MKTVKFKQNIGNEENVRTLFRGLSRAGVEAVAHRQIGETVQVEEADATLLVQAMPGAVEVA